MVVRAIFFPLTMFLVTSLYAQKLLALKLPDSGQNTGYTATKGEDCDFNINPPAFTDNGDGTITDLITGLMWQKTDGGEMTFENATVFCTNFALGGYRDWRLPTNQELFGINKYDNSNPALNTSYFTKTSAEYWWTSIVRADDATKVWVVNAGGGTGAHPKAETISAGGTKRIHVRAVRSLYSTVFTMDRFKDNGDGTIKDNYTGLVWQKIQSPKLMTWEEAFIYAANLSLSGKKDWRLPNVKELQSLNDEKLVKPSFNKLYFTGIASGNYWTSTTLMQQTSRAWDLNVDYGIVSYNDKVLKENVLCVRGCFDQSDLNMAEVKIPGGEFEMGDHHGFVDPSHPSDELPVHKVKVNAFSMATTETSNQQFLAFLNAALVKGSIEVLGNIVYATGRSDIFCYTNQFASYYSIGYDGKVFSISDFRANHPMVGMMWYGAAAYCNWLSVTNGLQECYNLTTWTCDFSKNGYRLPTEAEWEFAGRGGQFNPYLIYPTGNIIDIKKANLPQSGDPYETGSLPNSTPVGFYDGKLKLKTEFNWPGSATSYQTSDGANAYGLYDMQGNVWELLNDWYGQNYYSLSPYDNPKGPDSGFLMPDGKAYRGMRGGNWYNGLVTNGVNDGHSRVANRNPSYYRGPQDPNHPWYHIGFRVVRNSDGSFTEVIESKLGAPTEFHLEQNYPNPFNPITTITFSIPVNCLVTLKIFNALGQEISTLVDKTMPAGTHQVIFDANRLLSGIYFYKFQSDHYTATKKMILIK